MALQKEPGGPEAPRALLAMAEIHFNAGRYAQALGLYERILREHPGYGDPDRLEIRILECRYRTGAYEECLKEARRWLDERQDHPMRGQVLLLMGMSHEALGDASGALRAYLASGRASTEGKGMPEEIRQRVEVLIARADPELLESLLPLAAGGAFEPPIYHRLALAYLEQARYEKAEEAAMALVRATASDDWVSRGREILERIASERSLRRAVIGCLLPLSGPFSIYGQEVLNGIQLGLEIPLYPKGDAGAVELVIRDTGGEADKAVSELEDLVHGEDALGVIGPLSSKVAAAVSKEAQVLGIPTIVLSQREGIPLEGAMVFRNFITPSREVRTLVSKVVEDFDFRRFAVLCPENAYGRHLLDLFREEVERQGGVVTVVEFYREEETDFARQIKKMVGLHGPRPRAAGQSRKAPRPPEQEENEIEPEDSQPIVDFDAVFIPDSSQRVIMIAPQLPYHDVKGVVLLGTSLWQSPELLTLAGDYLQGAIFPTGFFPESEDPAVVSFREGYTGVFGSEPGVLAATGYDTVRFLAWVLSRGPVRSRGDLQRALTDAPALAGVTGALSFDETGETLREPFLLTVSGNRLTLLPPPY
jgi:ABC-type branched-subunit amino acid transport system substrate-binding protein